MKLKLYPPGTPEGEPTYEQGYKDGAAGFYPRVFGDRGTTAYLDGWSDGWKKTLTTIEAGAIEIRIPPVDDPETPR